MMEEPYINTPYVDEAQTTKKRNIQNSINNNDDDDDDDDDDASFLLEHDEKEDDAMLPATTYTFWLRSFEGLALFLVYALIISYNPQTATEQQLFNDGVCCLASAWGLLERKRKVVVVAMTTNCALTAYLSFVAGVDFSFIRAIVYVLTTVCLVTDKNSC